MNKLLISTGDTNADHVLHEVINLFEITFPARIIGYYLEGSYADQTAISTSDLDITIVFRGDFANAVEQQEAHKTVMLCKQASQLELDISLVEEAQLQQADPIFKLGSRLFYGQEIRDRIPLIPIATWARQRMHAAYWLTINVFQRPKPVTLPLEFPQPESTFYGYTARTIRLPDGVEVPTTRNLIRVTGWIATARIAHEAQKYVIRKRECVQSYRQLINDE